MEIRDNSSKKQPLTLKDIKPGECFRFTELFMDTRTAKIGDVYMKLKNNDRPYFVSLTTGHYWTESADSWKDRPVVSIKAYVVVEE